MSSATLPELLPEIGEGKQESGRGDHGYIVTVFDNDYNTYDEVMAILQIATGCTPEEAYIETWEIDHLGSSVVHNGSCEECKRVAAIISTIGIRVTVSES